VARHAEEPMTTSVETKLAPSATFDEVYVTRELSVRPSPASDHRQIKQAIQELAARMVEGPEEVLPRFVELAMELGEGVSAGVSIATLDASPPIFTWAYLKGSLAAFNGATTPRNDSPCGITLDQNQAILTRHSERFYSWIADVNVSLPEVLLVPLHRGKEQLGTLWVVSDELAHFNRAHVDAVTEVAAFVSIALQMQQTEARLSRALAEQETLAKEMSHRVKNVFSVVEGLIHLGGRRATTTDELIEALSGRVRALAAADGLTRRTFTNDGAPARTVEIGTLVRAITKPYEADGVHAAKMVLSGPEVALGEHATNGIALLLHELATNAAKYGALTRESGRVEVAWTADAGDLNLTWKERGGPLVSGAPLATGFGSRLVRDTVEATFTGTLAYTWAPDGVEVAVRIPLDKLRA
jgi:two-component sensor histidine kinase